jgi:translation initiation factor 3 subunit C
MVTKLHQVVVNAAPPAAVVNASIPHLVTSLALHERFFEARELFFQAGLHESHAGEGAAVAIATTRCLAHLGLAAFRAGHLGEAAAMLDDLCQKAYRAMKGFEIKELLGQRDSWPRRDDQTADELSAHDLLVPPHHHINVQLIEAAHMTATVLSEALAQARAGQHNTHRLLQDLRRRFEARNLAGAPADDAERLYAAYVAVVEGDATTAVAHVRALNAWNRLAAKEATLEKVCERVKVDALRVFLTAHGGHFKSLTVGHLAQKFGLDADTVRGTVSHMILFQSSSIVASFDRDGDRLDIERGAQPRMHELAREIATGLEQDFREAAKASVMNRRSYGSHGGRGAARGASSAGRGSASAGRGAARGGRGGRGGRGQPRAE